MKRKIIFFDIDGTIMEESAQKILQSTISAIQKARENGHYAVINTGRTGLLVGPELREKIGFDGYLFGCGTSVKFAGKDLMHQTLPHDTAVKIVSSLRQCKIDGVLEGEENLYIETDEKIHSESFRQFAANFSEIRKTWDEPLFKMDKMFLFTSTGSDMEAFQKEFHHQFEFIDREKGFWEVIPNGYSKASGIQYLIDYLGMSIEDTVAIGDSNNDLSMLSYAGTSIAMGNANEEIQGIVDYVTTRVEEDGIYNALRWLEVI